jgi:hypothetical protein
MEWDTKAGGRGAWVIGKAKAHHLIATDDTDQRQRLGYTWDAFM